ncbi:MAG: peptidylprolyl isomerase [Candidatus Hydrogenedentes bacterium]|nr:peptidylprolyl isomerase [Candidatus Hydrogenedentota bacterium]
MISHGRTWFPAVLGLALAFSVFAGIVRSETVDQVVANVDTEVILLSDIMAELGPQAGELRRNAANEEEFNKALQDKIRATLEQAIENKILLREAQLAGLVVDDDTVEKRLEEYKKLFDSNEAFLKELENAGETLSDLRSRLRKQMLARTMAVRKTRELEDGIVVSESEVAQYYEDHKSDFSHPERVRCYQIFIAAPADAAQRAVAKARLEQLRDDIDAGSEFGELAVQYSEAPGKEDGGVIGWVERGDLVKALEDTAFGLEPGQISGVVESDSGFHLLTIDKKEDAGLATLDEVRKDIEPLIRSEAASVQYKKWMDELKKRSRVRVFI